MSKRLTAQSLACSVLAMLLLSSCYKRQIEFGNDMNQSDTRIVTVDTITPVLSTLVLDSFPTSGANMLLIGRCVDPLLGATNASTFFQLGLPTKTNITDDLPFDATYDSLVLVMKPNPSYYGDTTKPQTFSVYELAYQPNYTYADKLYNTSTVDKLPVPWASTSLKVNPVRGDSLRINLSNVKGAELFSKIKNKSEDVQSADNFMNYIKGLCIQVSNNDNGAVYNFNASDSTVSMRLYYHISLPAPESRVIEFPLGNTTYQFNRVVTDRSGTPLVPQFSGQIEFPSSKAYPYSFTQAGTGVLMKITFPSLRDVLKISQTIRLLDARLVIRPVEKTWDYGVFPLPPSLFLSQTDATNSIGYPITDTASSGTQFSPPIIDEIYRLDTRYSFNITSYVNFLLSTANSADNGVFVMEENPGEARLMNRAVMGSWQNPQYRTQLVLTVMTID
jgi:Domain of unknown function (DUF4270)